MNRPSHRLAALLCFAALSAARAQTPRLGLTAFLDAWSASYRPAPNAARTTAFGQRLSAAALARTDARVRYVPAYVKMDYPGGDAPADTGVCSDEVIRVYRALGVDLQRLVHEDMQAARGAYPNLWGAQGTDTNIDHRRVPNLMVFFARHGLSLPVTQNADDYQPGDVVVWVLSNGLLHTGMLVAPQSPDRKRHLVVHNIGEGPKLEDALWVGKVVAHFRYEAP